MLHEQYGLVAFFAECPICHSMNILVDLPTGEPDRHVPCVGCDFELTLKPWVDDAPLTDA